MRSGANFDSACNDEGRPSEPLGNSVDSKQHKDVGLVVEIFSGSCRLSKACRRFGLRALPIDKDPKRAENCAVANYDLSDPQQYATLVEVLTAERESIVHAHCAPSCGTASRARGRKVAGVPMHSSLSPYVVMISLMAFRRFQNGTKPEWIVQMLHTRPWPSFWRC